MKATRNNIKMPFLCTKGFTNGNPQIHWALKIRLDHLSRVEWSGKPTIEKSNTLKTFPSLITQLFSWLLGNRKYFHVPLYCEKLHFVLLERIFHRRNLLSTFHWFHLSQHEKIPFLSFLTQTQNLNGWPRNDTFKEWKLYTRITGWAKLPLFFLFKPFSLRRPMLILSEKRLLKRC